MTRIYLLPSLTDVLEFGSQALVLLAIAGYCLVNLRKGTWAVAGLAGGLAGALPMLVLTYSLARLRWADDPRFADALDSGRFLSHLHWARLVSVLLLGVALVLATRGARRTVVDAPPAPDAEEV